LDPLWRKTTHLPNEATCGYLLGSGKKGADEWFRGDAIFPGVLGQLPAIRARFPAIARAIDAAAKSGFKGGNLCREPCLRTENWGATRGPSFFRVV
jgi:hypothetical protein